MQRQDKAAAAVACYQAAALFACWHAPALIIHEASNRLNGNIMHDTGTINHAKEQLNTAVQCKAALSLHDEVQPDQANSCNCLLTPFAAWHTLQG
jgi:hypothetical protein